MLLPVENGMIRSVGANGFHHRNTMNVGEGVRDNHTNMLADLEVSSQISAPHFNN